MTYTTMPMIKKFAYLKNLISVNNLSSLNFLFPGNQSNLYYDYWAKHF